MERIRTLSGVLGALTVLAIACGAPEPTLTPSPTPTTPPTSEPTATPTPQKRLFPSDPAATYLGRLSTNKYDPEFTSNLSGTYGNPYSPKSINNPFGKYTSRFSPYSSRNPYTFQIPKLFASKSSTTGLKPLWETP
ncbi:hypothetical protein MYX75_01300 [Acidobacteria bacterium AH-259-A15]|nr:hypothetical protein [Acidobacteria bacterium AH-259-A15]